MLHLVGWKSPLDTLVSIAAFFLALRLTLITVLVSVSTTNTVSGDDMGDDEGSDASLTGDICVLVGKIIVPLLLSKLQSSSKNPDSSEEVDVFIWIFLLPWLFWMALGVCLEYMESSLSLDDIDSLLMDL